MAMSDDKSTPESALPALSMGARGVELRTFDDLQRFGGMVLKSPFCPKGFDLAGVCVAMQMGMELGLTPTQALQGIAVVNGRPSIYGDLGTALVRGSGLLENVHERYEGDPQSDAYTAVCELWRAGEKHSIVGTFSVADAKAAKLWGKGGPWSDYPRRMLMWRARTYAYRDGFADVLRGLTFREEAEDVMPRDVTASMTVADISPQAAPESAEAIDLGGARRPSDLDGIAPAETAVEVNGSDGLAPYGIALDGVGSFDEWRTDATTIREFGDNTWQDVLDKQGELVTGVLKQRRDRAAKSIEGGGRPVLADKRATYVLAVIEGLL